jgi:hypothetical protein
MAWAGGVQSFLQLGVDRHLLSASQGFTMGKLMKKRLKFKKEIVDSKT